MRRTGLQFPITSFVGKKIFLEMRKKEFYNTLRKDKSFSLFEKSVLKTTFSIPYGETRSYKWIAKRIGAPHAYRAAGRALNKNTYIGTVPCHRVIKSDGSLGGFDKGKKEKRRLLKREDLDLK